MSEKETAMGESVKLAAEMTAKTPKLSTAKSDVKSKKKTDTEKGLITGRIANFGVKTTAAGSQVTLVLETKKGKETICLDSNDPTRFAATVNVLSLAISSGRKLHVRTEAGAGGMPQITELEIRLKR
jgi:hypothetical protein